MLSTSSGPRNLYYLRVMRKVMGLPEFSINGSGRTSTEILLKGQ